VFTSQFSIERTMSVLLPVFSRQREVIGLDVGSPISLRPSGRLEVSTESLILAQDERWRRA
jgi:hypothetical protein